MPVSAVSPAILTTQIEVQKKAKSSERPPILPPPVSEMEASVRRSARLTLSFSIFLILSSSVALSQPDSGGACDPDMRAMTDELQRSVAELQFKDLDKPYFIQYIVVDQERYRASATFGALTASDLSRARYMQANVRVGDYEFDNSEFVAGPGFQGPPPSGITTQSVVDNDYEAIRHGLWLTTDAAYKQAVEQLARNARSSKTKCAAIRSRTFRKSRP